MSSLLANGLQGQQNPCLVFSDVLASKGFVLVSFFFCFLTLLCSTECFLLEGLILSYSDLKISAISKSAIVLVVVFRSTSVLLFLSLILNFIFKLTTSLRA